MTIPFAKGEALGNDYLVVEAGAADVTPALARRLCDRHRGAGSDGVLVVDAARRPFRLRIVNPDGSEAEKSGNGLRILAAWLHHTGRVDTGTDFEVELATDRVTMTVLGETPDGALDISVRMGRARFPDGRAGDGVELELAGGERVRAHPVSLGNPHCVVVAETLDRDRFERIAPQLERHAHFPAGTNVQFARRLDPGTMEAWIFERGAGETLASGSSACAVAAVARRLGLLERADIEVRMPGGAVAVHLDDDYRITLRGPARMVYQGEWLQS